LLQLFIVASLVTLSALLVDRVALLAILMRVSPTPIVSTHTTTATIILPTNITTTPLAAATTTVLGYSKQYPVISTFV